MAHLRPTRLVVGLAVAALALSTGPALAASANPPVTSAWAATGTTATHLLNATALGAPPAATPVPVTVTLAPRNGAGLDALIADQANPASSSYHHYLTPAGFAARFGATPAELNSVTAYLRSAGLSAVSVSPNHLSVTGGATAASAQKAFHTTLGLFNQAGRTVLANTTPALVPQSLAGVVSAIVGLNQAQSAHGFARRTATHAISPTSFNPPALATAYDATPLPAPTGSSLAILAEGNLAQVVKDLRTEEAANNLPQVPVTIVPTGPASSDTSGLDEWDLDTQTSTAMANTVKTLYLYDAPSLNDPDIVNEVTAFVSQDKAQAGSASFGECDSQAVGDGTATAVDNALREASAQGQTLFASSGDTGSSCAVTALPIIGQLPGPNETSYPASGTYTAGVGGTTLTTSNGTYAKELGWSGSGGGISAEAPGSWTTNADSTVPSSSSSAGGGLLGGVLGLLSGQTSTAGGRDVPDLAMDADPNTGANIVVQGRFLTVGGTSLASPLAAGAWTRINGAHGNSLGPAAPALYGLYNSANPSGTAGGATPGLHDVVSGSNGSYSAKPGYDLVTGLGTIDVAALNRAI
ncbi:MAG: S53 family peptidase [Actinomycetota bacterium]|nr:S53 family peptidase [Actinomycetota bacterium]